MDKVLVVGGRASNFPQSFLRDERVEIWMSAEKSRWRDKPLPPAVGEVIFTSFISHGITDRLFGEATERGILCHRQLLGTGEVRRLVRRFLEAHPLPVELPENAEDVAESLTQSSPSAPPPSAVVAAGDFTAIREKGIASLNYLADNAETLAVATDEIQSYIAELEERLDLKDKELARKGESITLFDAKVAALMDELAREKGKSGDLYAETQRLRQEVQAREREIARLSRVESAHKSMLSALGSLAKQAEAATS